MPIHIKDLRSLPDSVKKLFDDGFWVFSKSGKPFSFISLEQANEHNVKTMKGSGRITGLQQDQGLLQRWTIVSPEIVRLLIDFENEIQTSKRKFGDSNQINLAKEVKEMVITISRYGNPFHLETTDLMSLDSHEGAGTPEVANLKKVEEIGKKLYETYVENILVNGTGSFFKRRISPPQN